MYRVNDLIRDFRKRWVLVSSLCMYVCADVRLRYKGSGSMYYKLLLLCTYVGSITDFAFQHQDV